MAGDTYLTLFGNLTGTPKSGLSRNGDRWTRMRIATTSRVFDRTQNDWRDGETMFLQVNCWRRLAENVVATLERGDRVLVCGRLRQRTYDDQQGVRHVSTEVDAEYVGSELGRFPARLLRAVGEPREPGQGEAPGLTVVPGVPEPAAAL